MSFVDDLEDDASDAWDATKDAGSDALDAVSGAAEDAADAAGNFFSNAIDLAERAIGGAADAAGDAVSAIEGVVEKTLDAMEQASEELADKAAHVIADGATDIAHGFSDAEQWLAHEAEPVLDKAGEIAQTAEDTATAVVDHAVGVAGDALNLASEFVAGAASGAGAAAEAVGDVIVSVTSTVVDAIPGGDEVAHEVGSLALAALNAVGNAEAAVASGIGSAADASVEVVAPLPAVLGELASGHVGGAIDEVVGHSGQANSSDGLFGGAPDGVYNLLNQFADNGTNGTHPYEVPAISEADGMHPDTVPFIQGDDVHTTVLPEVSDIFATQDSDFVPRGQILNSWAALAEIPAPLYGPPIHSQPFLDHILDAQYQASLPDSDHPEKVEFNHYDEVQAQVHVMPPLGQSVVDAPAQAAPVYDAGAPSLHPYEVPAMNTEHLAFHW